MSVSSVIGGGFVPGMAQGLGSLRGMFDRSAAQSPSLARSAVSAAKSIVPPSAPSTANLATAFGAALPGMGASAGAAAGLAGAADSTRKTIETGLTEPSKLAKFGKAGAIVGGLTLAQGFIDSMKIDRAEKSQMKLIAEEFKLAESDLQANANIRENAVKTAQTRSLLSNIEQLERMKGTGGIQRQQFLEI